MDKKIYIKKDSEKNSKKDNKKGFEKKNNEKNYNKKGFEKKGFEKKNFEKRDYEKKENVNKDDDNLRISGRNAVLEALNSGVHIDRILIKKSNSANNKPEGTLRVIAAKAKERGIVVQEVAGEKLDTICELENGNHQGVMALCPAFEYAEIDDMIALAKEKGEDPFIIVLDEINDPHNLGAIIRTADACGAHGVIIPKRRACGLTGTVVRVSAGAAAFVKVARVTNIVNTIGELKKKNIWVACADLEGDDLYTAPLTGAIAVVVGGEGEGVGPLVRKNCDFAVKIPMKGKISSLNASAAAAIVMYEVVRRRTVK